MDDYKTILTDEVKNIVFEFFKKASDNGTNLISFDEDGEKSVPIMDCGIQFFEVLKNPSTYSLYKFRLRDLNTSWSWSEGLVRGAWGHFQVNLTKEEILVFQNKLSDIFQNIHKFIEK